MDKDYVFSIGAGVLLIVALVSGLLFSDYHKRVIRQACIDATATRPGVEVVAICGVKQ